jgi:hypothetical protein
MGSDAIAIVMVMGTLGICVVTIVRTAMDHIRRTRSERTQAEMFNTLMNKLGNGAEVLGYLETESGKTLLKAPQEVRPSPYARILNSAQLGVVLTILGIGILSLQAMLGGDREALVVGTLVLTVGIGMLSAAGASWFLSKKFGLMETGGDK